MTNWQVHVIIVATNKASVFTEVDCVNEGGALALEKIGDRIGQLLAANGLSQKELAVSVGVTESAMSRYLSNDREPKIDVIARMAMVLHTSTDYLIYGNESFTDFDEVYRLVANNATRFSDEEKLLLVKTLAN